MTINMMKIFCYQKFLMTNIQYLVTILTVVICQISCSTLVALIVQHIAAVFSIPKEQLPEAEGD